MTATVAETHIRSTPAPPAPEPWTEKMPDPLAIAMVTFGLAFGALGAYSSFGAVHGYFLPSMGSKAWTIPVGVDAGIAVGVAGDLWMTHRRMRTWWLRWLPWLFTAGTVYLNVAASDGDADAAVGHVLLVTLWIGFVEGLAHVVKHRTIDQDRKRAERMDRIRWSRLLVSPITTVAVLVGMLRWEQRSYTIALARQQTLQALRMRYRANHGRLWRRKIDPEDLLAYQLLRKVPDQAPPGMAPAPPPTPRAAKTKTRPATTPAKAPAAGPAPAPSTTAGPDVSGLLEVARTVARDLQAAGTKVTRDALGAGIRDRGHACPNSKVKPLLVALAGEGLAPAPRGTTVQTRPRNVPPRDRPGTVARPLSGPSGTPAGTPAPATVSPDGTTDGPPAGPATAVSGTPDGTTSGTVDVRTNGTDGDPAVRTNGADRPPRTVTNGSER